MPNRGHHPNYKPKKSKGTDKVSDARIKGLI
jgi:hypothetical protein